MRVRPVLSRVAWTTWSIPRRTWSGTPFVRPSTRRRTLRSMSSGSSERIARLHDVPVGRLLDLVVAAALLVLGDLLVVGHGFELVVRLAPDVPDRDAGFLGVLGDGLHELLPPLLGRGWDCEPDHLSVVDRREPEVRRHDGLLDRLELAHFPRLDRERAGVRHRDGRHLVERRRRAVVVRAERGQQPRRGAPGPHGGELAPARRAPAVSVVKKGFPVPAAKMTTRPFSRCRMARRRMYGSATARISIAESTRVCKPAFSSASWSASALITVASMPM